MDGFPKKLSIIFRVCEKPIQKKNVKIKCDFHMDGCKPYILEVLLKYSRNYIPVIQYTDFDMLLVKSQSKNVLAYTQEKSKMCQTMYDALRFSGMQRTFLHLKVPQIELFHIKFVQKNMIQLMAKLPYLPQNSFNKYDFQWEFFLLKSLSILRYI